MREAPPQSRLAMLVDPFERFGGGTAVVFGAVISIASIAASRLGIRFDGFLDFHVSPSHTPALWTSVADQLVGWLLPAACFWAYARVLNRHVRAIDFLGMAGLARLPILIGALATFPLTPPSLPIPTELTTRMLVVLPIALACGAANITLLYKGFKNAAGLTGTRLVGGFVGLVVFVEVLSHVALVWLT
ncbi:MAG: hypothetical protein IAG13_12550 [Deltaproteobacteria bacterium]|nr:hypothetical protein [Nannocystaceae bacterium]